MLALNQPCSPPRVPPLLLPPPALGWGPWRGAGLPGGCSCQALVSREDDEGFTRGHPYLQPELLRHSHPGGARLELGAAFTPHKGCPGHPGPPAPLSPAMAGAVSAFPGERRSWLGGGQEPLGPRRLP